MRALIIAILFGLTGCTSLHPDYATVAYVHQSQPNHGEFTQPIGDDGASPETNLDGLELGLGWEKGPWFFEAGGTYMIRESNVKGGPWIGTFRGGIKVRL